MGVSVGCQPSWDALDSPGYLIFLLALSKKKKNLSYNKHTYNRMTMIDNCLRVTMINYI